MTQHNPRPSGPAWWEHLSTQLINFFNFIFRLSHRNWNRFVITSLIALFGTLVIGLFLTVSPGEHIIYIPGGGKITVTKQSENSLKNIEKQVFVEANTGFQNSGIRVLKGQHIKLIPEGRIHLSVQQLYAFTEVIKPIVVNNSPKEFDEVIRNINQPPNYNSSNIFYRNWVGPDGDSKRSDTYEECKLLEESNWGALLAVVMHKKVSSETDPIKLLKDNGPDTTLIDVSKTLEFNALDEGWLTFIVNEAVFSGDDRLPDESKKKKFYKALDKARERLSGDTRHQLPSSLPLVLFYDNLGTFRVTVQLGEEPTPSPEKNQVKQEGVQITS